MRIFLRLALYYFEAAFGKHSIQAIGCANRLLAVIAVAHALRYT